MFISRLAISINANVVCHRSAMAGGVGVGVRLRGGGGKSSAAVVKMYGDLDASTAIGGGGGGKMTPNNVSQYLPWGEHP